MALGVFWHFGGDAADRTGDDSFFPHKEMDIATAKTVAIGLKI